MRNLPNPLKTFTFYFFLLGTAISLYTFLRGTGGTVLLSYDLLLALLMRLEVMQPVLFNPGTVSLELNWPAFLIKPLTFSCYGIVIDVLIWFGRRTDRRGLTRAEMQEIKQDELPKQ
ncbi:hypothetical protein CR205_11940 [Alteribacter lacisalsi]|uniref:Uncharacterized protein n=1 Tax=Alteribacter lacisalsi TaxID=2045244 RepID=A0A2W0H5M5_9BACI|nr:hypothetical protein [Alteribacter lacisalsi]PYZ96427.1 hypothetical protein CR205_11940 [Alteribacter lacisalsi]